MFEFFAGGTSIICGNCTDIQGGCVLGTTTEKGLRAFAKPNGTDFVKIESEDFGSFEIEIGDTEPKAEEAETFAAIVRGIMNCFIESGNIFGGFDAKIISEIPLEKSFAAFEILIGKIISGLFFENSVPVLRLAEFGTNAESDYYGRPCGLGERLVAAVGGTVFADFSEPEMPVFQKIGFDFEKSGYAAAVINSKNPDKKTAFDETQTLGDMALVSWNMGHNFLSESDEAEFIAQFPILRQKCGERAVFGALRFFNETRTARECAEFLEIGDFSRFLETLKDFGKNIKEENEVFGFVLDFLGEKGSATCFCENVLAFVPEELAAEFAEEIEKRGFELMFLF